MSKNMCNTIEALLPDYIDGRLSADDKERVQEHMKTCQECAQRDADLRSLFTVYLDPLRSTKETDVDWAAFRVGVNERIDAATQPKTAGWLSPAYILPAAAALITIVGLWLYSAGVFSPAVPAEVSYADLFSAEEIEEIASIAEEEYAAETLSSAFITDEFSALDAVELQVADLNHEEILDEIDATLMDMFDSDDLLYASMEYLETEQILDALSEDEAALLASAMEIHDIGLE